MASPAPGIASLGTASRSTASPCFRATLVGGRSGAMERKQSRGCQVRVNGSRAQTCRIFPPEVKLPWGTRGALPQGLRSTPGREPNHLLRSAAPSAAEGMVCWPEGGPSPWRRTAALGAGGRAGGACWLLPAAGERRCGGDWRRRTAGGVSARRSSADPVQGLK